MTRSSRKTLRFGATLPLIYLMATLAVVATGQPQLASSLRIQITQSACVPSQIQLLPGRLGLFIRDLTGLSAPTFVVDVGSVKHLADSHVAVIAGKLGRRFDGAFVTLTPGTYYIWEITHPSVFTTIVVVAQ